MRPLRELLGELQQRKVFKVASIYLVTAWGAALGASELLPHFGAADLVIRALVLGLLLLFPVVVGLAWFFEVTREGVVRDPRDRINNTPDTTLQAEATATLQAPGLTLATQGLEVIWEDRGKQKRRTFSTGFTAGRDAECEVTTLDPIASRRHARFELEGSEWVVTDLGSSNGTLVNGLRTERRTLPARCQVQLGPGGQMLELRVLDRSAATMILGSP
jgi:pSer/pThr/pTyr-binding forkhead associated (FHA) protein